MRAPGRALATWLAALLLATSPLWAAREADDLPPPPRPTTALFSSHAGSDVLVSRVYASSARDDEFIEIGNRGIQPIELHGWALTDREATASFPLDSILPAGGRLIVTRNSTSFSEDTRGPADFTYESGDARRMEGGVMRLADDGDEVLLLDPTGTIIDAYVWGDSSYAGPGWSGPTAPRMGRGEVAVRARDDDGMLRDRDTGEDWDGLRRYRLGQSAFEPSALELRGRTTAVLSPDDGDRPLLRFLASSRTTIEVGVYTFSSERIASVLADAAARGVRVRVLLDGGPVGGIEETEHRIVGGLLAAGIEVRWLASGPDVVKRYRYLHAKYAVVDARAAWVGSENFGDAGFPESGDGNRGWSVVVEDADVARVLRNVFDADFDPWRRDSIRATEELTDRLPPPPELIPWIFLDAREVRPARLILAPDTSLEPDGVLDLFASARQRLSIQAFYFDEAWRNAPSPFLEAAFEAAHRGVAVRILLDGSWTSVEAESGINDDVLTRINGRARNESVSLEVRLLDPRGRILRLHNKGAVADGRAVLVSSMNWALGSATENREVGILVEDPDLAATFERAFDADWDGRPTTGPDAAQLDPLTLVALFAFVGVASAVSLRKLRAEDKDIKPRARVRTRGSLGADLRGRRGEVRLLSPELVAQPRPRAGRGRRARRGREEA